MNNNGVKLTFITSTITLSDKTPIQITIIDTDPHVKRKFCRMLTKLSRKKHYRVHNYTRDKLFLNKHYIIVI